MIDRDENEDSVSLVFTGWWMLGTFYLFYLFICLFFGRVSGRKTGEGACWQNYFYCNLSTRSVFWILVSLFYIFQLWHHSARPNTRIRWDRKKTCSPLTYTQRSPRQRNSCVVIWITAQGLSNTTARVTLVESVICHSINNSRQRRCKICMRFWWHCPQTAQRPTSSTCRVIFVLLLRVFTVCCTRC